MDRSSRARDRRYRLVKSVRSVHDRRDGGIVLDITGGRMFAMDRVASRILELLEAGRAKEDELVAAIENEFESVPQTARAEIRDFLDELCKHGLISLDQDQNDSECEVHGG